MSGDAGLAAQLAALTLEHDRLKHASDTFHALQREHGPMTLERHAKSSGQTADTMILWCRGCGWASEPFPLRTVGMENRCAECGHHGLSFMMYHRETESELAHSIIEHQRAQRGG